MCKPSAALRVGFRRMYVSVQIWRRPVGRVRRGTSQDGLVALALSPTKALAEFRLEPRTSYSVIYGWCEANLT